jgi:transposase
MPQTLLPIFPAEAIPINELISFCKRDESIYYFHGTLPVFTHAESDLKAFRMHTQAELVRAFGISSISMKRYVKKLRTGGSRAFFAPRRKRQPRVLTPEVLKRAQELLAEGQPRAAVAKALELKPDTLSKAVRAGRLVEPQKKRHLQHKKRTQRRGQPSRHGHGLHPRGGTGVGRGGAVIGSSLAIRECRERGPGRGTVGATGPVGQRSAAARPHLLPVN